MPKIILALLTLASYFVAFMMVHIAAPAGIETTMIKLAILAGFHGTLCLVGFSVVYVIDSNAQTLVHLHKTIEADRKLLNFH